MKTKFFILSCCLMFGVFTFGQNKQPGKSEIIAAKIDSIIQSGSYEMFINQANPMNGIVRHLTPDYYVRISGDSTYVFLPYFGRAYRASFGGDGGIKISNTMDSYKVDYKKGKSYSIRFNSRGNNDTYRFNVTLWVNGRVSINVTSNNRQSISYSGELKMPD